MTFFLVSNFYFVSRQKIRNRKLDTQHVKTTIKKLYQPSEHKVVTVYYFLSVLLESKKKTPLNFIFNVRKIYYIYQKLRPNNMRKIIVCSLSLVVVKLWSKYYIKFYL